MWCRWLEPTSRCRRCFLGQAISPDSIQAQISHRLRSIGAPAGAAASTESAIHPFHCRFCRRARQFSFFFSGYNSLNKCSFLATVYQESSVCLTVTANPFYFKRNFSFVKFLLSSLNVGRSSCKRQPATQKPLPDNGDSRFLEVMLIASRPRGFFCGH
jgi:hypothetical protein